MSQQTPKRGDRFLHNRFKSPRFSLEQLRQLPSRETAQEFQVTKVSGGTVCYRPVYMHGDREYFGNPLSIPAAKFHSIVLGSTS